MPKQAATRQSERNEYLDEFEEGEFSEVIRSVSPTNPSQKKSGVLVKKIQKDDELYILIFPLKVMKPIKTWHGI